MELCHVYSLSNSGVRSFTWVLGLGTLTLSQQGHFAFVSELVTKTNLRDPSITLLLTGQYSDCTKTDHNLLKDTYY